MRTVVSHPVWVRGLKLELHGPLRHVHEVAPRVGAWIETSRLNDIMSTGSTSHPVWVRGLKHLIARVSIDQDGVAPRVGAWIETRNRLRYPLCPGSVAPRVGAWIETFYLYLLDIQEESHPVWVRGLKQRKYELWIETYLSHPVWVRGLKQEQ